MVVHPPPLLTHVMNMLILGQGKLYANGLYAKSPPLPDALPALLKLRSLGYGYLPTSLLESY